MSLFLQSQLQHWKFTAAGVSSGTEVKSAWEYAAYLCLSGRFLYMCTNATRLCKVSDTRNQCHVCTCVGIPHAYYRHATDLCQVPNIWQRYVAHLRICRMFKGGSTGEQWHWEADLAGVKFLSKYLMGNVFFTWQWTFKNFLHGFCIFTVCLFLSHFHFHVFHVD